MLWVSTEWFVYTVLRFDPVSHLGRSVHFFVYDSVKIMLLLFGMISVMGFLRTFVSQRSIKALIARSGNWGHVFAASFGALTPFCSCSSIPLFISFLKAGIPLGITFSFLVTSPLINEYLVVLMLGFFGWKITAAYCLNGLAIGVFAGMVLARMRLEPHLEQDIIESMNGDPIADKTYPHFRSRIYFGVKEAGDIVRKLWLWVLIGVGVGAVIHNYVPQESIHAVISKTGWLSVPLAVIFGVPIYGSCAAIVPIGVALFQKGLPIGTVLAFMMSVSALSLPEAILLRRAMRLPLIALFFGVTAAGIVLTGYFINFISHFLS